VNAVSDKVVIKGIHWPIYPRKMVRGGRNLLRVLQPSGVWGRVGTKGRIN